MALHGKNKSSNFEYTKDPAKRLKFSVLGLEFLESRMNPTGVEGMDLLDYAPDSQALNNSELASTQQLSAWRNQGADANSWNTNTVQSSNAIFGDNAAVPFRWISTTSNNEQGDDKQGNTELGGDGQVNDEQGNNKVGDDAQGNYFQEGTIYTVRLEWTFSGGTNDPGQMFIDYLTTYNATESATGPFPASFTGSSNSTISIPTDPDSLVKGQTAGVFNLYNIDSKTLKFTSGSVSDRYVEIAINNNESHKYIDIQFTPNDGDATPNEKLNVGIAWGGHLASEAVYGINKGSSNFPGASTTMSVDLDPSSKGDVSTININSNNAIVPQGSITIVMDSLPNSLQDFTFMASGSVSSTIPASFTLDDDNGVAGSDSIHSNSIMFFGLTAGTYTFTQNSVSGWSLSNLTSTENGACDTTASDIYTTNLGARTLTITLVNGEAWTGTFSNTVIANSPPVVTTAIGVTAFTEGNNVTSIPVVVDAVINVNDSDNGTLSTGAVSITGNFQAGEDILAFTNVPTTMGNIVGIYNPATGVLSLSSAGATATLVQWQAALRSITYTNSSNTPSTLTRTVSFRVNDGTNNSNLATKQVSVTAVNDAPIAVNDSYTTSEDNLLSVATLGVLGNDTDADGNPLTSILVSGPSHGSLIFNANGSFSYTPNANYNGPDSFTYKANDGSLDSAPIVVSLTITAVNDAPVAVNDSYTTSEDTLLSVATLGVLANDTDADGNPLTSILVSGPSHGSLTFNANGSFSYTPNANYNGPDSFTYKANDGSLDSAPIVVSLTITAVNDAPVSDPIAAADAYTTNEDTLLSVATLGVLANDTDVDGNPLTSILVSGPSHGSLTFNANGSLSYTPNTNYNGSDSFTYKANDGSLDSAPILVSLTITAVNDPPVSDPSAAADAYTTLEDTVLNVPAPGVLANDTDVDGDALTSILVSGPSHGSLTFNADGSFSYTPNLNYNGPDSFTYKANDGSLDSAPIVLSLTITAVVPVPVVPVVEVPVPVVPVIEVPVVPVPIVPVVEVPVPVVPVVEVPVPVVPVVEVPVPIVPVVPVVPPITQAPLISPHAMPVNVALRSNSNAAPNGHTPQSGAINYLATGTSPGEGVRFGAGGVSGTNTNIQTAGANNTTGSVLSFPGFNGEVRVAHADFNNDGILDIVVAAGPGGGPNVRVINGATGAELGSFFAFDPTFIGGVFVAAADVNNDGFAEIVVGAGPGGGPHVKIFDGRTFAEKESFFAYDPSFRGGVSVAVFDFNNDGFNEIVTGAGAGGSPHVKVFDGSSLRVIKEFMAYALTFRGGVYVAAGDFNSDLVPDIITGAGAGGGPHVKDWNYNTLALLDETMAFDNFTKADGTVIDQMFSGGVRVAIAYGDIDGKQDLIVGAGPGGGPHVKVYCKGHSLDQLFSYFSGDQSNNQGVFVG